MVLDSAMGTMIQKHNLEEDDFRNEVLKDHPVALKGNNDLLSLTRPELILDIHRENLEAGADIIETNTFSGTQIAQSDYQTEHLTADINRDSAKLAKQAAEEYTAKDPDKPRFVAGSMGPTNKTLSLSPKVEDPGFRATNFDELKQNYAEQAEALLEGGADILLIETIFDTLNAKAALFAIHEVFEKLDTEVPIMVSGTITDASGRTLSGQTAEAFLVSMSHMPLMSIGLNCALGAEQLFPYVDALSRKSGLPISAHPNAGLPNEFGGYDQSPEEMAELIKEYLDKGVINIIGGCCGTTPDHIRALSELAAKYDPRPLKNLQNPVML